MLIQRITIEEFRSYSALSFKPDPGLNVLSGANAQGKTNLLEAMGILLVGRSFRGTKAVDLPRWGASVATVQGAVVRGEITREIRRTIAQREDGGGHAGRTWIEPRWIENCQRRSRSISRIS